MAQKLWEKNVQVNAEIDRFTVGRDREMDLYLAKHDVIGSMAHITMLESIGLLQADELAALLEELKNIYASAEAGDFVIEDGIEDVHVVEMHQLAHIHKGVGQLAILLTPEADGLHAPPHGLLHHLLRRIFAVAERGVGVQVDLPKSRPLPFPCVHAHEVIFSCLILWSMTWREASSFSMSEREMPASVISTMTW